VLITAADVLHAWWMPALGVKKDAIPGFVNETWFEATETGVYRGQCAELCGMDHGFMPIVVEVMSRAAFADWLAEMGSTSPGFAATNSDDSGLRTAFQ
jgi:cytochrome c oxidase subunit 2